MGAAALRPRRPGDARGSPRGGRPRHDVRRADRGRGRARRRDRRRRPLDRDGASRRLWHGGVDERAAPRSRGNPPRSRDQVRGLLPRPRRRAARERGLGRDDARHPFDARGAGRRHRRHDRLRVQRRRRRGSRLRALRRRARGDPRRARGREHGLRPSGAGLPRGAPLAGGRDRRVARVRRGDDRLPGRPGRRAGALRRGARPDGAREDRRRRPARGGVRRAMRADGAARPRRRRVPGGHPVREPPRHCRRDLGRAASAIPGSTTSSSASATGSRPVSRRSERCSGWGRC